MYHFQLIFYQHAFIALCKMCLGRKQISLPFFWPKPYTEQWTYVSKKKLVGTDVPRSCVNCPNACLLPFVSSFFLSFSRTASRWLWTLRTVSATSTSTSPRFSCSNFEAVRNSCISTGQWPRSKQHERMVRLNDRFPFKLAQCIVCVDLCLGFLAVHSTETNLCISVFVLYRN